MAFLRAGSKVSPQLANTIARMELCAAVYAALSAQEIKEDLHLQINEGRLYSDSNVVLGYLHNHEKRFAKYVVSRVSMILNVSHLSNLVYIPTHNNPF